MAASSVGNESGILSDIQILERLVAKDDNCIFISPLIDPKTQLGPSSLDLRLGTDLSVTRNAKTTHIDLGSSKDEIEQITRTYFDTWKIDPTESFVLHPGEFALASTLEFISLPLDIAGRLEGRSTIGRQGLQVHATAGFVDPGFYGTLTFELINSGRIPLKLSPGERLGQICFFRVLDVQVPYVDKLYAKYAGSYGVELSKKHMDPENPDPAEDRDLSHS